MWQYLLVLAIVGVSAGYSTWSLLPPMARGRLRNRLAAALVRLPAPLAAPGRRLLRPAAAPVAAGCATCPAAGAQEASSSRR